MRRRAMDRTVKGAISVLALQVAAIQGGVAPAAAVQQTGERSVSEHVASWVALDVPPGYEGRVTPALAAAMPGWTADRWGNLVREVGDGDLHTVVACALDEPAYAATQITDDGYLRLHRIGRGSGHDLWDQQFEAQQVRILTRDGPVTGVIARTNGHFAAQHREETSVTGPDDLWLDVGAESAAEARALGIELLDPVVRHLPPWVLAGGQIAGPSAGARAGCAALAALAESVDARASTRVTFVMSAQEEFGWVGLSSRVARADHVDELVLLAPGADARDAATVSTVRLGDFGEVLEARGIENVIRFTPDVLSPGSHMEVVESSTAEWLYTEAGAALGHVVDELPEPTWVTAPAQPDPRQLDRFDVGGVGATLRDLVEIHAASGHEWEVRRYVLENLPAWARDLAVVDDIGNVTVAAGPDRDTTVFMAHLDEVGYEITEIGADGVVELQRLGGALNTAWEGQTALVHFDPPGTPSTASGTGDDMAPRWKRMSLAAAAPSPPLPGVFLTRDDADRRDPPGGVRAWFGVDGQELRALGVTEGLQVTSHKEGLRLGTHRFVGRGLDDRAGTTALLRAIRRIDPGALPAKVIFAWSVHEEGGLIGAAAMARRFGASTTRIFSIDTFVSSDTPLESPHFAYTPLGSGPVFRAIENSGVSPVRERDRVLGIAEAEGIPLQTGLTQGGTDGTTFTYWGAPNQGLSWPGRYSHSPGEVLDLRDLRRLVDLVVAVATAG